MSHQAGGPFLGSADEAQFQNAVAKLSRRFLLILVLPLLVILALGAYSIHLTLRIKQVEEHAKILNVLHEMSIVDRFYARTRNYVWASKQYEKLAQQYPHPDILDRLAGLHTGAGNHERALELLEQAKASHAKSATNRQWQTYSILLHLYLDQKREKEAAKAGETAVKLNEWDDQTYNNLAWIYATSDDKSLQDLDKAKAYALRAVDYTRGRYSSYLDTLAEVHFRRGEAADAIATIGKALNVERQAIGNLERQKERFERGR